jgi:putative inorganic carbon (hco3(-)) transporter
MTVAFARVRTGGQNKTDAFVPFFFLCIYMILILVRPQEWVAQLQDLPVIRLSLLLAFFSYLALQQDKTLPPQTICCMLLAVFILLSGIRNGWFSGGLQSSSNYILSAVLPIIVFSGLTTTVNRTRVLMWVAIAAALLMVHHGIAQKNSPVGMGWTGSTLSWMDRITYVGFFNDPNDLGMFFVMTLPFVALFFLQGGALLKLIMALVALYILYGVYLTNSRGALVSLVAMAGVFSYLHWGKAKTLLTGILLSPALIFIFLKFRSIDIEEESAAGRVDSWYEGMQLFFWRPVFGVGQGNFLEYHHITAHNSYVLTLAELGSVGYGLWMVFLLLTLYMVYPQRKINNITLPAIPETFSSYREQVAFFKQYDTIKTQKWFSDCMFYSMIGFAGTVFFLSRTYAVIGYVFAGIAIAQYYQIAKFNGLSPMPSLKKIIGRVIWLTIFSIFALVVMIKVML